ncbi:MAG: acetate--CoA ligase [Acidobacteriota bacterium]
MDEIALDSVLEEQESVAPPQDFLHRAIVADPEAARAEAARDVEAFWARAAQDLEWVQPWDSVLEWAPPNASWFGGGRCNIVQNALDRHLDTWRRHKVALIWEGENGDRQVFTYAQLHRETCRLANGLKALGAERGDRITIYMPICPQLAIAMLASARIGAVHSVVFGGFSSEALRSRIQDAESKILIIADGAYYRGKAVPLKEAADEAAKECPSLEHMIVYRRCGMDTAETAGRDIGWDEVVAEVPATAPLEVMEANDPLYILYTSGTTGSPKGIVHRHGGYMVGTYLTTKWVFDLRDTDLYWCVADPGWVTGHSYVVYGPLINGATVFMAEGAPDFPDPGRWWSIIERYGINILYATPTAIRTFMGKGEEWPGQYDLSSLRLLGTVGEPINPAAWHWYHRIIGGANCPIVDTWWQTETGMILLATLPAAPQKPGSAGLPFPGIEADVIDAEGNSCAAGKGGYLVIRNPWPAMLSTIYKDPDRYRQQYWELMPGVYTAGDAAVRDEDGYIRVLGRMDDVLNVAGHRLGTMEIESALVSHPAVSEAAVIGIADEIKGQVPKAFIILQRGICASDGLARELRDHVGKMIGKIARPEALEFTPHLPKTRSGKIMRRLLKARERGEEVGDTSTLDPASFAEGEA